MSHRQDQCEGNHLLRHGEGSSASAWGRELYQIVSKCQLISKIEYQLFVCSSPRFEAYKNDLNMWKHG
jgi:hypothetical protein